MSREVALQETLRLAVADWIARLDGSSFEERRLYARSAEVFFSRHGDALLYRDDLTPLAFKKLAMGLAVLAYQPGGVKVFGMHFQARHFDGQEP
jgi:hypothetical protein